MAGPSVTYTFTNGTVADATQVNQNFTDLINGLTDGTKDLNINALTAAGTATLNGNVIIGNAAGDTVTVNGTFSGTGGQVSDAAPGLFPAANSSFADATATRLGLKQYLADVSEGSNDTAYNGGNKATIARVSGTGTLSSILRATLIPYQMQDGTWRIKIAVQAALSADSRNGFVVSINGITFKNVSNLYQAWGIVTVDGPIVGQAYVTANDNDITLGLASSTAAQGWYFYGDWELNAKPTWAY